MQLASFDDWVATLLTFLEQRGKRCGHKMKLYADTFTSQMSEADNQLIVPVRRFLQIWEPEETGLPSEVLESDSEEGKLESSKSAKESYAFVRVSFCGSNVQNS